MSHKLSPRMPIGDDELFMRIAAHLRERNIRAGDPIPSETELSRILGTGRQQVREALSTLEGFGAVHSRQGARRIWRGFDSGTYALRTATLLSNAEESARELLEVRHALETSLLPKAAARLTRADLTYLRALAVDMVDHANRGESFAELDEKFHRTLLAPIENTVLDGLLQAFWALFSATRPPEETVVEDPDIAAMHGRIVDEIGRAHV